VTSRQPHLATGYELEDLADVLLLRKEDGSVGSGTTEISPSEVAWTAEEDRRTRARNTA
jgi:hypothetical protein